MASLKMLGQKLSRYFPLASSITDLPDKANRRILVYLSIDSPGWNRRQAEDEDQQRTNAAFVEHLRDPALKCLACTYLPQQCQTKGLIFEVGQTQLNNYYLHDARARICRSVSDHGVRYTHTG